VDENDIYVRASSKLLGKNARCPLNVAYLVKYTAVLMGDMGTLLVNYFLGSHNSVARQLLIEASMSIFHAHRFDFGFSWTTDFFSVEIMLWVKIYIPPYLTKNS
jgi:hypothetical protein